MLQFRVSHLYGALTKIHGMALVAPEGIRLAFQEPDEVNRSNRINFDVKEVLITWNNLNTIEIDRSILGDKIKLRVKSTDPLQALSEFVDAEMTLETRRQDRDALDEFEREVADYRAGRRSEDVDDMLDDIRDFLS